MEKQKEVYEEFCEKIIAKVKEHFEDYASVQIHKIVKNNSVVLDALNIVVEGENISPNFYLQHYYEEYLEGRTIEEIVLAIANGYECSIEERQNLNFDMAFSYCKSRVVFRLVSLSLNRDMAEKIPYLPFMDMMITFHVVLQQDEAGVGSVRVTNEIAKEWGVDAKELFDIARKNTPRMFPVHICSMFSMMTQLLSEYETDMETENTSLSISLHENEPLVVTNTVGINGASVILYKDVLDSVAQITGGDYYILPSSIHEVLAVPMQKDLTQEELKEMVCEVNGTCVAKEEILSDSVYRYHVIEKRIELCSGF